MTEHLHSFFTTLGDKDVNLSRSLGQFLVCKTACSVTFEAERALFSFRLA
jgi:hypothetical protein